MIVERKTFGEGIGAGKAVIIVQEKGLGDGNHPFWKWLLEEGFHLWLYHPNYGMDWVFINLNSMTVAPGMPGIKVTSAIREHAITIDEFKTIWGIFMKYEGLPVLKMSEEPKAKLLLQDKEGNVSEDDLTQSEVDQLVLKGKVPLKENALTNRVVNEWLKNPSWRKYYETAPSDKCRELIVLEFMYSDDEGETEEILWEMNRVEAELKLADWQHLFRYCGNNPRKKKIHDRIVELGGE